MNAVDFFAAKLAFETDAADVAHDARRGSLPYTLIDTRSRDAYEKAHLPGAISLPYSEMTPERIASLPVGPIVTYCWSPACNAATKGAHALAAAGREVREMLGGFEYWVREGHPVEGRARGPLANAPEPDLVGC
jgi:rhodanese-related sulfurtransferase